MGRANNSLNQCRHNCNETALQGRNLVYYTTTPIIIPQLCLFSFSLIKRLARDRRTCNRVKPVGNQMTTANIEFIGEIIVKYNLTGLKYDPNAYKFTHPNYSFSRTK